MADTLGTLEFNLGGANVSVRSPANGAVGTYLPMSISQVALSTDDTRIYMPKSAVITDYIAGPATGTVAVEINGLVIPTFLDNATQQAGNSGRKKLNISVPGGAWLRLKVMATLPA